MLVGRKLSNFPSVRQADENSCIPASVEGVTKYFRRESVITQQDIWSRFEKDCATKKKNPSNINLGWMKEFIDSDPEFQWATSENGGAKDFQMLLTVVKNSIDNALPVIISIPVGNGRYHMLTIFGYDNTSFDVHDPDPHAVQNPFRMPVGRLKAALSSKGTDYLVLRPK